MDTLQSTRTLLGFFPTQNPTTHRHNPRFSLRTRLAPTPLTHAHYMFDEIPNWDTLSWNTLIQTHLTNHDFPLVLSTYNHMLHLQVPFDRRTLPRLLEASRQMHDLSVGKQLHCHAMKLGFSSYQFVVTALIQLYGHLGSIDEAQTIFDKCDHKNLVCWTLLAKLYVEGGKPGLALGLFHQMVEQGVAVDAVALSAACAACGMMKSLDHCGNVHEVVRKCGLELDGLVSNSLVKMYVDCGSVEDARLVFEEMPCKDVVSWTLMVRTYVKRGELNEAIELFRRMNLNGVRPDSVSVSSILPACGRIVSRGHGREIHGYLIRNGVGFNLKVKNAVMDMYVKSGDIACAWNVFAEMRERDTISWTMMILGCSLHGHGKVGVDLFRKMEKESKVELDDSIYAAALHACSTARMAEEGRVYFNRIMVPTVAHCGLMVSLLVRCGLFDEARILIREHKIGKVPEVLRKLLEGCRIHGEYDLGKQVIDLLCELEPLNAENYVLLLNWYAGKEKWDMVEKLRGTIRVLGLKPMKACSWTLLGNKVHVFGTGDVSHPRSEGIYSALQGFVEEMRTKGVETKWDFSLHDVDEERECIQNGHSELLALAFGLISSQAGPIRVAKNSRVCHGCHDFAKFVSKMTRREIILKDPNFFHHFRDGLCTCEDFW
ncbi:Pentatricopeptide repeat-containing protein DOT4, chloroplastic, partial [Mucuna pruriens]